MQRQVRHPAAGLAGELPVEVEVVINMEVRKMSKIKRWVHGLVRRALVVAKAAPTYLVLASVVLAGLAQNLPELGPVGETAARWIGTVLAVLAGAVSIIRRVTPVLEKAERGLLSDESWLARPPGLQ